MIKKVIKKGGNKEVFDLKKIKKSLSSALEAVNFSQEEKDRILDIITKNVLDFLKNKKNVFTSEIEAKIILELKAFSPLAVKAWREYRIKKEK